VHAWAGGRWSSSRPAPTDPEWITDLLAGPDGAVWALANQDVPLTATLLRLSDRVWQVGPSGARGLVPGPDGTVCTIRPARADIACYDEGLSLTRTIPVGAPADAVGFAPDGAVWVVGEQVARIPTATG
jgi:hypothetical protein